MLLLVTTLSSDSLQIYQLLTHVLTSSTCTLYKTTSHMPSKSTMPPVRDQWLGRSSTCPSNVHPNLQRSFHWTFPLYLFPNSHRNMLQMMTLLKEPSSPTLAKKSSQSRPNTLVQKITWTQESMYARLVSTSLILTSVTRTRPFQLGPSTLLVGIWQCYRTKSLII